MANYYIQTAAGNKVLKQFDPDVVNAVYKASGLKMADLVLRGSDESGDLLYESEEGWLLDNLTDRELAVLRAFKKGWRLQLGD